MGLKLSLLLQVKIPQFGNDQATVNVSAEWSIMVLEEVICTLDYRSSKAGLINGLYNPKNKCLVYII